MISIENSIFHVYGPDTCHIRKFLLKTETMTSREETMTNENILS